MEVDDEPKLPTLPAGRPAVTRKRARDMPPPPPPETSSTSSDPAVFSSDDDPALDNYQDNGRRKRRYVGAWFDQHPASSDSAVDDEPLRFPPPRRVRGPESQQPQQKREFRRQLDSGVWMGTDGSLTDTDESFELEPVAARLPLAPPRLPPLVSTLMQPPRPRLTRSELEAQNTIRSCVENGIERVDLSGLDLETISDGLLDPIADIEPIPTVAKDVAFEKKDPRIQVFLYSNRLQTFPISLLNVEHLTVLSLRANQLTVLPSAIGRLKNLEALNVAQNYLNYLPGELLNLLQKGSKLHSFNFQPNRFWKPDIESLPPNSIDAKLAEQYEQLTYGTSPSLDPDLLCRGQITKLHSRSPVQFLDGAGRTYSTFRIPKVKKHCQSPLPREDDSKEVELEPLTTLAVPKEVSRELSSPGIAHTSLAANPRGARSLFELALRACAKSAQAERIADWLREDVDSEGDGEFCWPKHLAPAVERAVEMVREGGVRCAICGRDTLVPMTMWLEFRHVGTQVLVDGKVEFKPDGTQSLVPFLMVGCSWRCVPGKVEAEERKEEKEEECC